MSTVKFTFQDWLEDRFVLEYTMYGGTYKPTNRNFGELVLNDSSKYQFLVFSERMEMETWNQIQAAQADAYKTMVDNHLTFLKATFAEKVAAFLQENPAGISKRTAELKALLISDIEKFKEKFPVQYEAIAYPTQPRGTPVGAKFVTAQQYQKPLLYPNLHVANDGISIDPARMMPGEMEYLLMDAALKFRDYLENDDEKIVNIECKGLATFLFYYSTFEGPGKNNIDAWTKVLKKYGFAGVFTPATLGKYYNDMVKSSNRLDPKSDKNLTDALLLFERFPDKEGLKRLKTDIDRRKKGTLPA